VKTRKLKWNTAAEADYVKPCTGLKSTESVRAYIAPILTPHVTTIIQPLMQAVFFFFPLAPTLEHRADFSVS
jgi:hypothetical protein